MNIVNIFTNTSDMRIIVFVPCDMDEMGRITKIIHDSGLSKYNITLHDIVKGVKQRTTRKDYNEESLTSDHSINAHHSLSGFNICSS